MRIIVVCGLWGWLGAGALWETMAAAAPAAAVPATSLGRNQGSNKEDPAGAEWHWDDSAVAGGRAVLNVAGGVSIVFDPAGPVPVIRRAAAGDRPAWEYSLPRDEANAAAMLEHDGKLYVALYQTLATGGQVLQLDASTGHLGWQIALLGVGLVHHSKYRNRIQTAFVRGRLAIFGNESAGRYIEVLDPRDGRRLSHRLIKN